MPVNELYTHIYAFVGLMNSLVVAAASVNQLPLDWEGNARRIESALAAARKQGARVVCLPELCVTGYGCEDMFYSAEVLTKALSQTQRLARKTKGLLATFGLPVSVAGVTYNGVAVAIDGSLRGIVLKQHLAGDGVHYEPRWFAPWPAGATSSLRVSGRSVPVGDLVFEVDGVRIGFEICEDAWVQDRPAKRLGQLGVGLILNPSASHFAFGKSEIRKKLCLGATKMTGASYVFANLLGCEAGRTIYDGDTVICSGSSVIAAGPRFSFQETVVTVAPVDVGTGRGRRKTRTTSPRTRNSLARVVVVKGIRFPRVATPIPQYRAHGWEASKALKHEEFTRAVTLGLFDYLRKSRGHGFVVSLSGGVDSSAISCLVSLMVQSSVKELGLAEVKKRLGYIPWAEKIRSERDLCAQLLVCVYQATRNSSVVTRLAARRVAQQIGATFYALDVDSLVEGYKKIVATELGVKLSWQIHDVALQNIQARVRSPSIWLVANLRRALLLATSNRSEASVGYTTMDGDSSGGLAPIAGSDKAYLREWLRWLQTRGPVGMCAFSSLALVNAQAPTAELRPLKTKQTDEDDLMPYVVLDSIERKAVRDKLLPVSVYRQLCREYARTYSRKQLAHWVERFFALWSSNQWKRERFAPSFHLDDESVDPKTWCRFPILSSGYSVELNDLRKVR